MASFKKNLPEFLRNKLKINSTHDDNVNAEEQVSSSETQDVDSEITQNPETSIQGNISKEDKKKKQISMIIRVVVILGLVYVGLDEFFPPERAPSSRPSSKPSQQRRPKKKKNLPMALNSPELKIVKDKSLDEKKLENVPDIKNSAPLTPTPPPILADRPSTPTPALKSNIDDKGIPPAKVAPIENVNIAEKDKKTDEQIIPQPPKEKEEVATASGVTNESRIPSSTEKKSEDPKEENKKATLEEKIVADDVAIGPPAYDQPGRGLIYNCKEKYWACVNKTSYLTCNKNMKYNKSHQKKAECVIQNVYTSDDDCNLVQKFNVSSNKETSFCQQQD